MKKPSQIVPLLKLMLGLFRFGPIPLLVWFLSYGTVLYLSTSAPTIFSDSGLRSFSGELFGPTIGMFLLLMLISTPLAFQILDGGTSLEFLFTRAIDRGLWLRAQRIAMVVIVAVPPMINLLLCPWRTRIFDQPDGMTYFLIRGMGWQFAWLVWTSLMLIFLAAGYFSIVFTAWQNSGWHHTRSKWRPWLGGLMVNGPALSVVPLILISAALKVNPYVGSYNLFRGHPMACALLLLVLIAWVEPMTERNIKKLEFEFT